MLPLLCDGHICQSDICLAVNHLNVNENWENNDDNDKIQSRWFKNKITSPIIPFHWPPTYFPYVLSALSWIVKVKPSIFESSLSISTKRPWYLTISGQSIRDKINILGPPISAAEVVGRDEGPVGDRGDLEVDPPQGGHLHHGYGEHQDQEHQASHLARI